MNKNIENIINPPWLEPIRRIEKQMRFANVGFQESEAMRSIRKINETARLTSLAFNESELMKSVRVIADRTKLASLVFHEPEAMRTIREFTESNRLAMLALKESKAIQSINRITESARLATLTFKYSETAKQLKGIVQASQFASIALQQSEAFKQISQLGSLASFKALGGLDNSPFYQSEIFSFVSEIEDEDIVDGSLKEIDAQIGEEILSHTDFNELSEKTKSILLYLYHNYFLPLLLGCLATYIMDNASAAKKELESVSTPAEARNFVRAANKSFDRASLKGFRITTVHSLNFREAPSMKSEVITTLPIGSLVEVIDKSNRSWLFIEVEIDGVVEQGWISRRYTAYFK